MGGDVFGGREELVEVKFQISQDQKKWLEQMVKDGNKLPESINGRLSVRVAMGLDAMANLHQQLSRVIASLNAAAAEAQKKKG